MFGGLHQRQVVRTDHQGADQKHPHDKQPAQAKGGCGRQDNHKQNEQDRHSQDDLLVIYPIFSGMEHSYPFRNSRTDSICSKGSLSVASQ